jgi:hypothetical protein
VCYNFQNIESLQLFSNSHDDKLEITQTDRIRDNPIEFGTLLEDCSFNWRLIYTGYPVYMYIRYDIYRVPCIYHIGYVQGTLYISNTHRHGYVQGTLHISDMICTGYHVRISSSVDWICANFKYIYHNILFYRRKRGWREENEWTLLFNLKAVTIKESKYI